MQIVSKAWDAAKGAFIKGVEALGEKEVEKRAGVFVARYLDPINAKRWHEWGLKHGIPNLVPAEEMHVTVVYSLTDVKMARDERALNIETGPSYGDAGQFCMFGEKNDVLVFCFENWSLYNRHYEFLRNGAKTTWPTFRPHLTLSTAAGDFELPDAALAEVPPLIVLMGEVNADLKQKPAEDAIQDGDADHEDGDESLIIVIDIARAAAKKLLEEHKAEKTRGVMDAYALADIEQGIVTKGVAKRLAATDWAPQEIKDLAKAEPKPAPAKKMVEREVTMTIGPIPQEVAKKLSIAETMKFNEEKRKAYGWASIATVGGEYVTDLQGDTITTEAQTQFIESLFKGTRAAKLEHDGDDIGEVVQGLVFDADLQKMLGIDLGMEGLLTVTHYTCEKTWEMVKSGDWMHSIAGLMLVEE